MKASENVDMHYTFWGGVTLNQVDMLKVLGPYLRVTALRQCDANIAISDAVK